MRTKAFAREPTGAAARLSTTGRGEGLGEPGELHLVQGLAAALRVDAGGFEPGLGIRERREQRAPQLLAALLEGRANHAAQQRPGRGRAARPLRGSNTRKLERTLGRGENSSGESSSTRRARVHSRA